MGYYIYQHVRLDSNEVFYIGKGTKKRKGNAYFRAFTKNSRNQYWKNITQTTSYKVEILEEYESEAVCPGGAIGQGDAGMEPGDGGA